MTGLQRVDGQADWDTAGGGLGRWSIKMGEEERGRVYVRIDVERKRVSEYDLRVGPVGTVVLWRMAD